MEEALPRAQGARLGTNPECGYDRRWVGPRSSARHSAQHSARFRVAIARRSALESDEICADSATACTASVNQRVGEASCRSLAKWTPLLNVEELISLASEGFASAREALVR
jgi:hypothetical protein